MKVAAVALAGVLALAQSQQPVRDVQAAPQGTAVVSGTVFLGDSGSESSRRTRVMLTTSDRAIPGRTTTTDDEGRFTFANVPAGRFTLQAARPGYLTANYGAPRAGRPGTALPVSSGARLTELALRLIKGGAIAGTVRDAAGQPLPGVTVAALRYSYREMTGELSLATESAGSSTTSDDRGVYRVWGLPPGNYVVRATPQFSGGHGGGSDFEVLGTNDVARAIAAARGRGAGPATPAPPAPRANYAPVFFPGTPDASQATMLTLTQEEERGGVDVPIRMFRTARIEGSIRMFDGSPLPANVPVWLTPNGPQGDLLGARGGAPSKTATVDRDGHLVIADVAPGRYQVQANTGGGGGRRGAAAPTTPTATTYWAMADVTIDGTDVTVQLTLQPTMTAKGRFVFDGSAEPPKSFAGMRVWLFPTGSGGNLGAGPPGGVVGADGTFTHTSVVPGSYRFAITGSPGAPWTLQSATANGRDGWDGWLQVAPGENLDIVITCTDRPTEISGTLRDAAGQPLAEHFIVVFPAERARWIPGTKRIRTTRPGVDGQFSIVGLPAGDYLVVAATDVEPGEWNDPAFLEALAPAGVKMSLSAGEKKRQDLQIK